MAPRIAVHGHFYQPPREDPWTGAIPVQPGAKPFHDWNELVHAEAYRPNAFARIPTADGEVIVNNFAKLSFNIGPTLLRWMERDDPETYERILDADRASALERGRGNAIAQSYHHTILPLSPLRDVRTQIRWGLRDFRYRFERDAEGMWLPETAANDDVLEALIEEDVSFTILAPDQAGAWRAPGGDWHDATEDPHDVTVPYRYMHRDGSGRHLSLFFYDGDVARAIAFERAGSSAEGFIDLFEDRAADGRLVHAATDGETYGHHHRFTDLGLAYALFVEAPERGIEVTNYAAHLAEHPPELEAKLAPGEGSAWSCAHGVGRWVRDCGCSTGGEEGWNQRWRGPLREALEIVRDVADEVFDREGKKLLADPWVARDDYVDVEIGAIAWGDFVDRHASVPLDEAARGRAYELLELQRFSMSMFTSCAWFFNDCSGIETVQVLRYAARTLQLLKDLGQTAPEEAFLTKLGEAESNDPDAGTAADIYVSEAAR